MRKMYIATRSSRITTSLIILCMALLYGKVKNFDKSVDKHNAGVMKLRNGSLIDLRGSFLPGLRAASSFVGFMKAIEGLLVTNMQ